MRYAVFGASALVSLSALGAMAVQRRTLNPFGHPARLIRRLTDPMLKPIERRMLKGGQNPQQAPWWLLGIAIMGGILVVSATQWLIAAAWGARHAAREGGMARFIAGWAFQLLQLALLVRVIGSWIGATRYTPWMKPFYAATEWMLAPLRRFIPPFGPLDLTPLVAWFLLGMLARAIVPRL